MNWKYTDDSNTVAVRALPDGSLESCLAEALPDDAEVSVADPPSERDLEAKAAVEAVRANPLLQRLAKLDPQDAYDQAMAADDKTARQMLAMLVMAEAVRAKQ